MQPRADEVSVGDPVTSAPSGGTPSGGQPLILRLSRAIVPFHERRCSLTARSSKPSSGLNDFVIQSRVASLLALPAYPGAYPAPAALEGQRGWIVGGRSSRSARILQSRMMLF